MPSPSLVIETEIMRYAAEHTRAAHAARGQFVEWTGRSRAGKTTTVHWLANQLNAAYEAGEPDAYRVGVFEAAPIGQCKATDQHKQAVKSIYENTLGRRMDDATYRGDVGQMVQMVVYELRAAGYQMVMVDEAGRWAPHALEGAAHVVNAAGNLSPPWPLTLVLVGMHELPLNLRVLPQVENRVQDTVYFRTYTREQAQTFLQALHPFFAALDFETAEGAKVLDYILGRGVTAGLPGLIVTLVERADALCRIRGVPMSFLMLQAAHLLKAQDALDAVGDALNGFRDADDPAALRNESRAKGRRGRRGKKGRGSVWPIAAQEAAPPPDAPAPGDTSPEHHDDSDDGEDGTGAYAVGG